MTTTRRLTLPLVAAFAAVTLVSCTEPQRAAARVPAPAPAVQKTTQGLTSRFTENFESGLGSWTLTASTGSAWLGINPSTVSVSSALNPALVTLADTGAHLPAIGGGNQVAWFGSASTGTFIGSNYNAGAQGAKNGGSSASVQLGTMSSPSIVLPAGEVAQLEFDSWWEIEGVAAASYDKMDVLVSTNGGTTYTQLGRLNPSFAAPQPGDAAYSSGGPAQSPVWRRYVYNLTPYAGQTIKVQFKFDSGDTSYNAFRGFTVDNIGVESGPSFPAPVIAAVTPSVATTGALVVIDGANYLQGAQFFIGATQITAANITQFGASSLIFRVPAMAAGTYNVRVRNPDAQEFTLPSSFTWVAGAAPGVTTIAPATGSAGVSQNITITGSNFVAGAQVIIGGAAASSITVVSATQITASAPGVVAGTHNVVVRNPNGQEGIKYAAYTVTGAPPLTLTAPNGGESFEAGSQQTITWSSSGVPSVNIELYKGGVLHSTIASSVPSSGSYSWTVPGSLVAAADYRVRLVSTASSANDTSNGNFTITAPAGSVITVTPTTNGTITCNSPVLIGGTMTCTITPSSGYFLSALTDNGSSVLGSVVSGQYVVTNVTAPKTITGTFSSAAPVVSSPATGLVTSDATPTFTGSCVTGATVSVRQGASVLCSSACVAAAFSCTAAAQPEGALTVTARQADASGNAGAASTGVTITIDTLAPAAPAFTAPVAGSVSTNVTPLVTGTCETGASVSVFEGATLRCAATCIASAFSCTSSTVSQGAHTFLARQADAADNTSLDASVSFSIDSLPPLAPAISAPLAGASLPLATPSLSGSCETGAIVSVTDGAQVLCTTTCALSAFSCTSIALAEGPHAVMATQTDGAGNVSGTSAPVAFITDTVSPTAPGVSAPAANAVLSNAQPMLTGSCEAGATLQVMLGATVVCSTSCSAGNYACEVSSLPEGPHTLGVVQTDLAGNVSPSTPLALTIDLTAPSAPALTAPLAGAFLSSATPSMSGSCETGAQVEVLEGASVLCSASCAGGTFSCLSSSLADGSHQVFARQTDVAGNASAPSSLRAFSIDTQVAVATLSQPGAGVSLSTLTPTFGGACETGATVTVSAGAQVLCTVTCTASAYSCVSAALPEGAQSVSVVQVDQAGNTSTASSSLGFTLDVTAPQAAAVLAPVASALLASATPQVSGSCESGSTVNIFEGASPKCSASCVGGVFSCTSSALTDGAHLLLARQTDAAGNVSPDASVSFTVDTAAPQSVVLSAPVAGAVLPSATPLLAGSCESGSQVVVFEGFDTLCSATCVNSAFECTSSFRLDGPASVVAVQTDGAGNSSSPSAPIAFTIDTQFPAAPVVQAPAANATLANEQPTISGSCETGTSVQVMRGPGVMCTTSCVASAFSCVASALGEGSMTLLTRQTDAAGNQSPFVSLDLTIDLTAPVAPVLTSPLEGSFIATATPMLLGSCETGAQVEVLEGASVLCSASCAGSTFSCLSSSLLDGNHQVFARQTDAAGNASTSSSLRAFSIDTQVSVATLSQPAAGVSLSTLTPTFGGACETGATVTVSAGAQVLCTATCSASSYSCVSAALPEGAQSVSVVQVDQAGNTSTASSSLGFTLDVTAPQAPAVLAPVASALLATATPQVSGSCESGSTVSVFEGASPTCSASCVSGVFSCTSSTLSDGAHLLLARQSDAAGNISLDASVSITVDTGAPQSVVLSAPIAGAVLPSATPRLAGACESGSQVVVFDGFDTLCSTTCVNDAFECTSSFRLDGPASVVAVQTDGAGNASSPSAPIAFTIDTQFPAAPVVQAPAANATLANEQPTISGACETGTSVQVMRGPGVVCSTSCVDSAFSCVSSALGEGSMTLLTRQTDAAGNESPFASLAITVDLTAPVAPALTSPLEGSFIATATPMLLGSCESGAQVDVFEGATLLCSAPCSASQFSCEAAPRSDGTHDVFARQTDVAGNASASSSNRAFTVDTHIDPATFSQPAADALLATLTPTISGACESDATVTVTSGATTACTASCIASAFSCISAPLAEGPHTLQVSQVDRAGNTSTPSQRTVRLDATLPAAPTLTAPTAGAFLPATTLTIEGGCETGALVEVFAGPTSLCSAMCADEKFTCTSPQQPEGLVSMTAQQRDPAGNLSTSSPARTVTLDVTNPSALVVSSPVDGSATADNTPTFSGTCEPSATVQLRAGSTLRCETICSSSSTFSCVSSLLADGPQVFDLVQRDRAGNQSANSSVTVIIDTTRPALGAITQPVAGATLATAQPTLSGTGEPLGLAIVFANGVEVCRAPIDASGAWSCPSTLSEGPQSLQVQVRDVQGNESPLTPAVAVRVDITPPGAPSLLLPSAGQVVGLWPSFSGRGEPTSMVHVRVDGAEVCQARVDQDGAWSCLVESALTPGLKVASASAIDDAGLTSSASDEVSFEVRPVARPSTPVLTSPLAGDVVTVSLPRFVGRAEPGSLVRVQRSSGELCNAVATSEGDFECTSTVSLPDGAHQVTATAGRAAQVSAASQPTAFSIDTQPMSSPQLLTPQAGATVSARPTFSGTAGAGHTVAVSVDGVVSCSATADAQGRFACLPSTPLEAGARIATAVATNAAGQSAPSAAVSFTVLQTAAPSAPAIVTPADGTHVSAASVVFAGLSEPGSHVQVLEGTQVLCEADASALGDWTCTASLMSDGLHQVSARSSSAAGVSAESAAVSVSVDRLGSPAPQLVSPSEGQTTNAWPRFAGTATATERVMVRVDGREVCGAAADAQGAFSCVVMAPLASGAREAVAVSVAASGRASAPSTAVRFIVSTREPRLLAPTAGAVSSTKRPQLSGVVEPGSTVEAFLDGRAVCVATSLSDGSFSCVPTADEVDGLKVAHVIADDGFGTKRPSAEVRFVVDTMAPAAPGLTAPARGSRVLGDVVRFEGTAEPGSTVTVSVNGAPVCTAVVSASGSWSCDATGLVDGQQTVSLSTVDVAGNRSDAASSQFVAAVTLPSPALQFPEADSKVLGPEVAFSGTGLADTQVTVVDASGTPLCTATVAADDTFRCTATLNAGPQAVTVHAGWRSARSVDGEPRAFTVLRQAGVWGGGAGCSASGFGTGGLALLALLFARRRSSGR
ncbi:MAG: Ig-like domain-containing protein [Myxococcales bacterium]|nr:Ig-like domain-containing protein [Myxococcales bacterium]